MIVKKVIQIQCFIRQCFARSRVKKMIIQKEEHLKRLEIVGLFSIIFKNNKKRREVQEKKRLKEIESRLHPKNNKDFETLYNGLESKRLYSL